MSDERLKAIHAAVDGGQPKAALKLIQAALQKHGQQYVLRALLALVHAQLGEVAEARVVLRSLPALGEVDARTVHTLLIAYRTLDDGQHCITARIFPSPAATRLPIQRG